MRHLILLCQILFVFHSGSQALGAESKINGKSVFDKKCSGCHEIGPGAMNSVGPTLNGLFGRKAGTVPGYKFYSEANKTADIVWSEDTFKAYIRNPKGMIIKTKQLFNGLQDREEIDSLYEYLLIFSK